MRRTARRTQSKDVGSFYSHDLALMSPHAYAENRMTAPVGGVSFRDEKLDRDVNIRGRVLEKRVGRAIP